MNISVPTTLLPEINLKRETITDIQENVSFEYMGEQFTRVRSDKSFWHFIDNKGEILFVDGKKVENIGWKKWKYLLVYLETDEIKEARGNKKKVDDLLERWKIGSYSNDVFKEILDTVLPKEENSLSEKDISHRLTEIGKKQGAERIYFFEQTIKALLQYRRPLAEQKYLDTEEWGTTQYIGPIWKHVLKPSKEFWAYILWILSHTLPLNQKGK